MSPIISIRSQYYNDTEYILDFTFDSPDYDFAYFYYRNNAMINVFSYHVITKLIFYSILDFVVDKSISTNIIIPNTSKNY